MSDPVLTEYREIGRSLIAPDGPFAFREVEGQHGPIRILAGTYDSLLDHYDECVARFADRDMLEANERRWTFGAVMTAAARLGAALRADHGIAPGDRVALAMRNRPEWFIAFVAVTRIGAIATLVNSRAQGEEMQHAVDLADCSLVIADDRSAERLRGAQCIVPILPIDELAEKGGSDEGAVRVPPNDPAAILFTSGTTGRAKGAMLSHRNLTAAIRLADYIGRLGLTVAARRAGTDADTLASRMPPPSFLLSFPLFHISGVTNFLMSITTGALITLMDRWNPEEALGLIEKNGVTTLQGASLVIKDLLDQPDAVNRLRTLNSMTVGGQATPPSLTEQVGRLLPLISQGTGWGMTEVTGAGTSANGLLFKTYPDSCGPVLPLFDFQITGPAGEAMPVGEAGEIWVRGAPVIAGYWNDPIATAAAFEDGWFKTGDVGRITADGLLYMVDRKKDMIISAGENIYCAEVERVLDATGHFVEVALFGLPDTRLGERVVAAVVLREGVARDPAAVQAAVGKALADYKVPREIHFSDEPLPRNQVGKLDKVALRRRYAQAEPAQIGVEQGV